MLEGYYYDPKHGGCLRKIVKIKTEKTKTKADYKIIGAYGNDEPMTGSKWTAFITKTKNKNEFYVDFSGKKHVTHGPYMATWNVKNRTLNWEDGNTWKKVYDWYSY